MLAAVTTWALLRPVAGHASRPDSAVAGTLNGDFEVNANGAGNYSIELETPPGTNGVAPNLAIAYNSQAPDGILGLGFSLSGLSAISRCPATRRLDGYFGATYFDKRDRFCLDGQRLVKVAGAGDYPAAGSVYDTERETWTKVVAQGSCGDGPCSFVAWNKDGTRLDFGADPGTRVPLPNRPDIASWQIGRSTDRNGNSVVVSYAFDPGTLQIYPAEIRYTENPAAGLSATRLVSFEYESRPDAIPKYLGGFLFKQTKRLSAIKTWVGSQLILNYRIAYSESAGTRRSLVSTIQKCDGAGECFPPTTFKWQAETNALVSPNSDPRGQLIANWCTEWNATVGWMDFNGDGKPDLHCDTPSGLHRVLLSTGHGLVSPNSSPDGLIRSNWCAGAGFTTTWIDFNGDGKGDLACDGKDGSHRVLVSDGVAVHSPNSSADGLIRTGWCAGDASQVSWGNFNSDGRADLLCSSRNGVQRALLSTGTDLISPNSDHDGIVATGWCTEPDAISYWADFNGDHLSDVHCATHSGVQRVLLSTGTALVSPNSDPQGVVRTGWCAGSDRHRGATDFNGDGLLDEYCSSDDGRQWVLLSTGTGLVSANSSADGLVRSGWCGAGGTTRWGDFNGDGLSDLSCSDTNGRQMVLLSDGSTVYSPNSSADGVIATGWCDQARGQVESTDLNGDALEDLHCHDREGTQQVLLHALGFPDLLVSIKDGLGSTIAVTHKPLTDSSVYKEGKPAEFPRLDVITPIYVVAAETQNDGRGAQYKFEHRYQGARTDLEYREWLGFESKTTIQPGAGRSEEERYSQAYPAVGFPLSDTLYNRNGAIVSSSESTPKVLTPFPKLKVHQVLAGTETVSTFTNGTADFRNLKVTDYDAYGNPSLVVDSNRPDRSDALYLCFKYVNDESKWRLGYQRENKITRTEQACRDFLASPEPGWNPAADLRWNRTTFDQALNPVREESWDDRNNSWLATQRTFDAVGNTVTVTDRGGNITTFAYNPTLTFPNSKLSPHLASGRQLAIESAYNPGFGVLELRTDPNGNQQRQIIDGFGRIVEVLGPDPSSTSGAATVPLRQISYSRDRDGYYQEVRQRGEWSDGNPDNWFWVRSYVDGMGRPVRERSKSEGTADLIVDIQYDGAGREWRSSFPYFAGKNPDWTTTSYDVLDRPTKTEMPDRTTETFVYLQGALKVETTEASGTDHARTTVEISDARGNVIRTLNPNGSESSAQFDQLSQVLRSTSPNGSVTTLAYDSLGRTVRTEDSDAGISTWNFGKDGLLHAETDGANNLLEYQYDALNRPVRRTITPGTGPPPHAFEIRYDDPASANGAGNLTGISGPRYEEKFAFTRYNLVAGQRVNIDGETFFDTVAYDAAGRLSSRTFPDGSVQRNSYYIDGMPQSIELQERGQGPFVRHALWSEYDQLGQPLELTYGNSLTTRYTYYSIQQGLGRLHTSSVVRPDHVSLMDSSFEWNPHSEIQKIRRRRGSDAVVEETFDHDKMGWLTRASGPWGQFQYEYDPSGNLTLKEGARFGYQPASNLLRTTSSGSSFEYDGSGNQTRKKTPQEDWRYGYDGEANLIEVRRNGQVVGQNLYDNEGSRLQRTDSNHHVSRYVTDDFDVLESGADTLFTKYLRGTGAPLAAITTRESTRAFQSDLERQRLQIEPQMSRADVSLSARTSLTERGTIPQSWSLMLLTIAMIALLGLVAGWPTRRRALLEYLARLFHPPPTRLRRRHPFYWMLIPPLIVGLIVQGSPSGSLAEPDSGQGYPTPGTIYFHSDQIDSTTLVTDPAGKELSRISYLPFGAIDSSRSSGHDNSRPKFTGKEWDFDQGLYYYGARSYDPYTARFLTPDPADQLLSPYVYADDDPEDIVDPDGEESVSIITLAVLGVVGAAAGAYFGGSAVNATANPFIWDWNSGNTVAGIFGGAAIGAAAGVAGGLAWEGGVAVGIVGEIVVGAAESAAYAALGGGPADEIAEAAIFGAGAGAVTAGLAAGLGAGLTRLGRAGRTAKGGQDLAETGGSVLSPSRPTRTAGQELADIGGAVFSGCSPSATSFLATTIVSTEHGPKPISQVAAGDQVYSRNPLNGSIALKPATGVDQVAAASMLMVSVDGEKIGAGESEQFAIEGKGWTAAAQLKVGDRLRDAHGLNHPVEGLSEIAGQFDATTLEVADTHSFYVGGGQILVHNKPSCREIALGRTPGKHSATGKQVQALFKQNKMLQQVGKKIQVKVQVTKGGPLVWKPFDRNIHMGHIKDAVVEWNKRLWKYGAKSKQARAFMLDASNYRFEWGSLNMSNGSKLGKQVTYTRPKLYLGTWPP